MIPSEHWLVGGLLLVILPLPSPNLNPPWFFAFNRWCRYQETECNQALGSQPFNEPESGARIALRVHGTPDRDRWHSLQLDARFSYEWFLYIQTALCLNSRSPHTCHTFLSCVFWVTEELSKDPQGSIEDAVRRLIQRKRKTCPQSFAQVTRRILTVVNITWHELLQQLPRPLSMSHYLFYEERHPVAEKPVFSDDDVHAMIHCAPSVSLYAPALIRLLFTTGLRIAAVVRLQWAHIWDNSRTNLVDVAMVREKGNRIRTFPLAPALKSSLL